MTNNTRAKITAAAPEPDDSDLLLNLADMKAAAMAATSAAQRMAAFKPAMQPVKWNAATVAAAGALPVPLELPTRYPTKGPSAQVKGEPAFIAAPKDLNLLNGPTCPAGRKDPLLVILRAAVSNDWYGRPIYRGASAAAGGLLPLPVLLTMLGLEPAHQKARKWAQTLASSGQTNILAQLANASGRFVVCRPCGIELIQDFYATAD